MHSLFRGLKKFFESYVDYALLGFSILMGAIALILQFGFGLGGGATIGERLSSPAAICIEVAAALVVIHKTYGMVVDLIHKHLGVDVLAILAVVVTLFVSDQFGSVTIEGYWATLMIMVMMGTGGALEAFANSRATRELSALVNNSPKIVHRLGAEGQVEDIDISQASVGDVFLVKSGESVPLDGVIIEGRSSFDCSSLTGESAPVELGVNETVLSGSVNGAAIVRVRATQDAAHSQYQTIIRLVEEAEKRPARFVRMADRYAVPFTIVSLLLAGLAWLLSWAMARDTYTWMEGLTRATEVLVIASPCPLLLAAPIAFVSGMSRCYKHGIIVKNPDCMEQLSRAKTICFDKTGTLTSGDFKVQQIIPAEGFTSDEVLTAAAAGEQGSAHVLAAPLIKAASNLTLPALKQAHEVTGQGVEAEIGERTVRLGRPAFAFAPQAVETPAGTSAVYVAIDGCYAGVIILADSMRPESPRVVNELKELGLTEVTLLSGDKPDVAERIGAAVGITRVKGGCLPADKTAYIEALPAEARPVVMVGDGVNDSPSLAVADVGIAMGARGSTAAVQTADMVILIDDLGKVCRAVRISKRTVSVARQSVLIGIGTCVALMVVAAFGVIPAIVGAILQEAIDVIAITSAIRAHSGSYRERHPKER